jgi:acetyl-CoA acyltransferase
MTINRFCSSGVQAIALAADRIRTGDDDVVIAAGTESMSMVPMMGNKIALNDAVFRHDENVAIAYGMGITRRRSQPVEGVRARTRTPSRWRATRRREGDRRGRLQEEILPYEIETASPTSRRARSTARRWPTPTRARGRIPARRRWAS